MVKIVDVGLDMMKNTSKPTKEGTTLCTLHYMSLEQFQGEEVDRRTDIWLFGVVLCEMLTRQVPFQGDYESAMILKGTRKSTSHRTEPEYTICFSRRRWKNL